LQTCGLRRGSFGRISKKNLGNACWAVEVHAHYLFGSEIK
jgi:hypothetical protein